MDLITVQSIFKKFAEFMKEKELITIQTLDYQALEKQDINNIQKLTELIFAEYILKQSDKVNQPSDACMLYKQLSHLVDEVKGNTKKGWFY